MICRPAGPFVLMSLATAAIGAACAPRPTLDPRPGIALTAQLVEADGLVRAGCYACLTEALAIYERADATGVAPAAGLRAIDTALLLALRERELGLGGGRALEYAMELASRRAAPYDIGVYRAVAEVQAWHAYGVSKERIDESMAPLRRMFGSWQAWRARLAPAAPGDLVSAYYLLSLDCTARAFLRDAGIEPWKAPADAPPLLRYRAAVCPLSADAIALGDLLDHDPRFAEAHFFLGEQALGRGALRTSERHLLAALDAYADLTAARLTLGHVYLAMEDVDPALDAYHQVNAAVPGQREAMLGEVKALSYLGRHEDAVRILDEMERLGTWYMGEVYYWRAWNRHRLKQYDPADTDVLAARSRLPMDGQVDKLAGFIALARNEVPRAEAEFLAAVGHIEGRGGTDCEARYYLGSARVMQKKWAEAVPNFERAEPCYASAQREYSKRIEMIRASDLPEARKARLIAAKERDIASARLQEARSSFNAAAAYANLGETGKAKPFAERASGHPDLARQAKALLDILAKQPRGPAF